MEELKNKLESLCIFRELLTDPVLSALYRYLKKPTVPAYTGFVSALYGANGGNLGEYIKEICGNSDNVYVKTIGRGRDVPKYMHQALTAELDILQETAALTREDLCSALEYSGFLPEFTTTRLRLREIYLHRTENIGRYGYGIYAKNRMFSVDETGAIVPVQNPDSIRPEDLVDYERERKIIFDNTKALLQGKPAANILLTGDAGTGKSSTVKAAANALWEE